MGFDNSFDDNNINDWTDVSTDDDNNNEPIQDFKLKNYGKLGIAHVKVAITCQCKSVECNNNGITPAFFSKILIIRNTISKSPLFETAADDAIPSLGFRHLHPRRVTISVNPDKWIDYVPIGLYCKADNHISLDLDGITATAKEIPFCSKEELTVIVFLHELMHHVMRAEKGPTEEDNLYWLFREEALANALMLKALDICGEAALKDKAMKYIRTQPADLGYTYALLLPEPEIYDVMGWINEKDTGMTPAKDMDSYIANARKVLEDNGYELEYNKPM